MRIPFQQISDEARIWVYQCDQRLTPQKVEKLEEAATRFLNSWAAHGAPLKSAFSVMHDRFLILAVDETFNPVSGCSTDESVRFVQSLEQLLNVSFFDRSQIAFMVDHEIILVGMNALKKKELPFELTGNTITFNNLVNEKRQLDSEWLQPAGDTWLSRYLS